MNLPAKKPETLDRQIIEMTTVSGTYGCPSQLVVRCDDGTLWSGDPHMLQGGQANGPNCSRYRPWRQGVV